MKEHTIADERIFCRARPGRDEYVIYKVRYLCTRVIFDGECVKTTYQGQYGGIEGMWHNFEPMAELDFTVPGVARMDGRTMAMLRQGVRELEGDEEWDRTTLINLRNTLDKWIAGGD